MNNICLKRFRSKFFKTFSAKKTEIIHSYILSPVGKNKDIQKEKRFL